MYQKVTSAWGAMVEAVFLRMKRQKPEKQSLKQAMVNQIGPGNLCVNADVAKHESCKTTNEILFQKVRTYAQLSENSENAWDKLLRQKSYRKGEHFVSEGEIPTNFAFVVKGLLYEHYTGPDGDTIIKYFFPECRIAASVSATLLNRPSAFTITAIEDTTVLEYSFAEFKKLVSRFPDIAAFYIRYMEHHWIIEKEPEEISFRHDTAMKRYQDFVKKSPGLLKRLKQLHIAAWLGITPESLSRIRKAIADGELNQL